jgi:hypothetical protein
MLVIRDSKLLHQSLGTMIILDSQLLHQSGDATIS